MYACKAGKVEVVRELLEAGADTEKRDMVSVTGANASLHTVVL